MLLAIVNTNQYLQQVPLYLEAFEHAFRFLLTLIQPVAKKVLCELSFLLIALRSTRSSSPAELLPC